MRWAKPAVERVPMLARTYRLVRDGWAAGQPAMPTPMGFRFGGDAAMASGRFEPEETRIAGRILDRVDVLVNIGANIGYYACLALQRGRRVVAFEPMPLNVRTLLRNIDANGWGPLAEVYPVALGDRVDVLSLYGAGTGASLVPGWAGNSRDHATLVPCSTLDLALGRRLAGSRCFVIVDVEGAELRVLDGGGAFATMQPRPVWMVEIAVSEHQPAGITVNPQLSATFDFFRQRGYEARTADRACRRIEAGEIERIAAGGPDTLGTHNFLFAEPGALDALLSPDAVPAAA